MKESGLPGESARVRGHRPAWSAEGPGRAPDGCRQLSQRGSRQARATLSFVVAEIAKHGRCELPIGAIAARAACCATVVRNALRQARRLGLVDVEARRVAYDRNRSNVVRIVSAEWSTWLRMRSRKADRGGGYRTVLGT